MDAENLVFARAIVLREQNAALRARLAQARLELQSVLAQPRLMPAERCLYKPLLPKQEDEIKRQVVEALTRVGITVFPWDGGPLPVITPGPKMIQ
jgi:hypothetical protein